MDNNFNKIDEYNKEIENILSLYGKKPKNRKKFLVRFDKLRKNDNDYQKYKSLRSLVDQEMTEICEQIAKKAKF